VSGMSWSAMMVPLAWPTAISLPIAVQILS
jgi:hypothetical protein